MEILKYLQCFEPEAKDVSIFFKYSNIVTIELKTVGNVNKCQQPIHILLSAP